MQQDYRALTDDQIELIEKQTLRVIVQALQEYSREARIIFEGTEATTGDEITNLGEDVVQYALEVAELYPINQRLAGSIDYKRVRWMPSPFGLIPQALLVDAKAAKERGRTTLQKSQLPMDADFFVEATAFHIRAGVPNLSISTASGDALPALSTSVFVHLYYSDLPGGPPYRRLKSILVAAVPHQRLKHRYNPGPEGSFFGKGKESTARGEAQRIRVYFPRFRAACPWRLQELVYPSGGGHLAYTEPKWRDQGGESGTEVETPFEFIGR